MAKAERNLCPKPERGERDVNPISFLTDVSL
jgi:hypothetical protein